MAYQQGVGNNVIYVHGDNSFDHRAVCEQPQVAAEMLNKAAYLNDIKRQYTNAARLIAKAECLPGFEWQDGIE